VLAKGPAAVILAGGATLLWAVLSRQWRAPFRFLHPLIIVVFCATALPWYVLCALRNPEFLRVFIWQHNFQRYLTPVFEHRQPFWFYVPILLIATMPWAGVLGCNVDMKSWRSEGANSPTAFVFCWALFPLLFFSLSQSKLPGYILPSVPPLSFMMGQTFNHLLALRDRRSSKIVTIIGAGVIGLGVIGAIAVPNFGHLFDFPASHTISLWVIAVGGGLIAVGLSQRGQPRIAFVSLVLTITLLVTLMNVEVLPIVDSKLSARRVAHQFLIRDSASKDVAVVVARDWRYGLDYYVGRDLPEWDPRTPLPEWLFANEETARGLEQSGIEIQQINGVSSPYAVLLHTLPGAKKAK
jgi:4-amino-4-deoxy-L-arabinose transferase-like glycosyltransferase